MHSASLRESSRVTLIITPSQVKGLGPTVSQKEVELKTKLTWIPNLYSCPHSLGQRSL